MALETFSWDKDTGAGRPSSYSVELDDPIIRSPKGTGIQQTRPKNPIAKWIFYVGFSFLRPQCHKYVFDFYHTHRGGQLFYFQWPFSMYGAPTGFGGAPLGDPTDIWDTAIASGFGMGPIRICWFDMDRMKADRRHSAENYWSLPDILVIAER
jgi:hypothetical protein